MLPLFDFALTETIPVAFDTYGSTDGESVTITGLAVTDIEIYKDAGMTQRASDNGYALVDTDGIDLDGSVGFHGFTVDLSDNSDAGFYANGSHYWMHVNAITVDGQTVRFTYYFTIGRLLRPTVPGRTLDVTVSGNAGIDWGNIENTGAMANLSQTTIDTVSTNTDMRGTDANNISAEVQGLQMDLIDSPNGNAISSIQYGLATSAEIGSLNDFDPSGDTVSNVSAVSSIGTAAIANDSFAADVGNTAYATNIIALAVRKALDELNLDHLMKTAVANNADMTTEVPDGTVLSNIMSATSDTSAYVVADDSLQGISEGVTTDAASRTASKATSVTVSDKTGFKLASDGLDSIATTAPAGVASNFREMLVQVWRRWFKKATMTSTEIKTYADNGSDVLTTQTVSDDNTTQTQGTSS